MKKLSMLLAVAAMIVGVSANAADEAGITPYVEGGGILVSGHDSQCGIFLANYDGSWENGVCWQFGGIVPPDYGAFAEGYFGRGNVCAIVYNLTQIGNQIGQTQDNYVWCSQPGGRCPEEVLCVYPGFDPGPIAFWPSLSVHVQNADCDVSDEWYVGYWSNWPGEGCGWFVGIDQDGFGGKPCTNFAPGIGYPTGWGDPSLVGSWAPVLALGIGAEWNEGAGVDCGAPSPTIETTWGSIKALYN